MLGALLRILLDVECVVDDEFGERSELESSGPGSFPLGANSIAIEPWLRNLGYGAGAALGLGVILFGFAPGFLGAPGLAFWLTLPRVYHWAAMLLPAVGAVALYRSQDTLTAWLEEWWPLVRPVLDAQWVFRTAERIARVVGAVMWSAGRVIEGAGYMAWVLLFCLVALLLLRTG
jgi:hypothetical protein